jgi:hypothetical protein
MRFDQSEAMTAGVLLPAAAYDADNTPAALDIGKAQACTVLIDVGVGGITFTSTNKVEFKLTHCDTSGGDYTAVAQADVVGVTVGEGGIVRSLVAAHATPSVTVVGYRGRKQFLKLLADFGGTHASATPMSAVAVRGLLDRVAPPT